MNPDRTRPTSLYARALGLRHLNLSGVQCLLFGEGSLALGILLALAELTSWWAVVVLPVTVAGLVKINDVVAGAFASTSAPTGGAVAEPATRSLRADLVGGQPAVGRAAVMSSVDALRPPAPRNSVPRSTVPRTWVPRNSVPRNPVPRQRGGVAEEARARQSGSRYSD
jgi:hypothetical protein